MARVVFSAILSLPFHIHLCMNGNLNLVSIVCLLLQMPRFSMLLLDKNRHTVYCTLQILGEGCFSKQILDLSRSVGLNSESSPGKHLMCTRVLSKEAVDCRQPLEMDISNPFESSECFANKRFSSTSVSLSLMLVQQNNFLFYRPLKTYQNDKRKKTLLIFFSIVHLLVYNTSCTGAYSPCHGRER